MDEWEPTVKPYMVCAAIRRDDGLIICGARHFDKLMLGVLRDSDQELRERHKFNMSDQGFVDQFGRFYTREEAMQVARQNDQIRWPDDMLSETALHSEDMY